MGTLGSKRHAKSIHRRAFTRPGRENGAVAFMAVFALIIICGFCGLALDLSRVYNRKMELQNAANIAAVAAAVELNGTKDGVSKASQKIAGLFAMPLVVGGPAFNYGKDRIAWSDDAVEFSSSPEGPWVSYGEAAAASEPNGLLYAKVDTTGLEPAHGELSTWFMPVISATLATASTAAHAIAGPSSIAVTPLGICIMRPEARRSRTSGELEEYGFRRGVAYDLMQLNPDSAGSGQSFLIHPFAAPGASGPSASDFDTVAPFVCTGTMGVARLTGGSISVSSPFPLDKFYPQLNSRFDSYTLPCNPETAPPDMNVKPYKIDDSTNVSWMETTPDEQGAKIYADTQNNKRWTVTGPESAPSGTTAKNFGPLWSYAKAVKYADKMPSGGYVAYATSNWKDLYTPGQPKATSKYPPSATPYLGTGSYIEHTKVPGSGRTGVRDRRVLNVALLSCPVSGGKATVKSIGRFFMTVPADGTHLFAEFAGLADEQTLRAKVKLFQ